MATATQPKKFNHEETQRRVRHPLALLRTYIRRYIILEGLALTILCASLLFWLGLAFDFGLFLLDFEDINVFGVDWILELNELDPTTIASRGLRVILLTIIVVGLVALGFSKVVLRWLREFNDKTLALVLEKRFHKELGDRLITAVELADPKLSKKYGYSQVMVEKTIMEAVEILKKLPVAGVFNWKRLYGLWFMVGVSTFGLLLVSMVTVCIGSFVIDVEKGISPWGFSWRFYDTAAIWTERNVLMMNTYWPRRAHLEVARFQPSKKDANEMRVPQDEEDKGFLQVRAYEWVIADRSAPRGWRPLKWKDLAEHRLIAQDKLNEVAIPVEFNGWKMDYDELEPNLVMAVFGEDAKTLTSGEVRKHLKTDRAARKVDERGAQKELNEWLDWHEWSMDKLRNLMEDTDVRVALRKSGDYDRLDALFDELADLADSPLLSRTIRRLDVPQRVEVSFRGEETTKEDSHKVEDGNKYTVPLKRLTDSKRFRFLARGDNYFTPVKMIALVAAPTPTAITIDSAERPYIYHRLPFKTELIDDPTAPNRKREIISADDQMPLADPKLKHIIKGVSRPITGDTNTINVTRGTQLTINVQIDNTPLTWNGLWLNKLTVTQQDQLKLPAKEGLFVTAVDPGTPAHRVLLNGDSNSDNAGLKTGDVLLQINGDTVANDLEALAASVKAQKGSHDVNFVVLRDGKKVAFDTVSMPATVKYEPRKLRAEKAVFASTSPNAEKGSEIDVEIKGEVKTKVDADLFGFSLALDSITSNKDFTVEFFDEDNIRGKRRFKIQRTLDAPPSVDKLSVFGYNPRTPRFKAPGQAGQPGKDNKEAPKGPTRESQDHSELAKSFLITSAAQIPLECRVTDDYGLTRVGYHYKYRKVDVELIGIGGSKKLPVAVLQINEETRRFHAVLAASNLQLTPTNPFAWYAAPNYIGYSSSVIQRDIQTALGFREEFVSSPAFEDLLKRKLAAGDMRPLQNLVLTGARNPRAWEFDFKDDRYFDLGRNIPALAVIDPKSFVQNHYHLELAVQATDNNVETGDIYAHEMDVYDNGRRVLDKDGNPKKESLLLRGNTRKNGNGYLSFLVITENELLAQIALEEELLQEKLEAAKDRIDKSMVSLLEQQSKISAQDIKAEDLEGVITRMHLIRTAVGTSGNHLREAHGAYENILKEMQFNRVKADRMKNIEDRIIVLLDRIVVQDVRQPNSGTLPIAEEAYQKTLKLVEDDIEAKRAPDVAEHRRNFGESYAQMDRLSKDIQHLLDAMQEGIVESRLIAFIAAMEAEQRKNTGVLNKLYNDAVLDRIKGLIDDKTPPKKEEKKEDKKDEKKSAQLRLQADSSAFTLASPAASLDAGARAYLELAAPVCFEQTSIAAVLRASDANRAGRRANFNLGFAKELC